MKQETAIRNAMQIAQRLAEWGGRLDTPECDYEFVAFRKVWLFGSTAQGKSTPGDIDIMYDLAKCGGQFDVGAWCANRKSLNRILIELRRGMKNVRFHTYQNDKFALAHGSFELWPFNVLAVQEDYLRGYLTHSYKPVVRQEFPMYE